MVASKSSTGDLCGRWECNLSSEQSQMTTSFYVLLAFPLHAQMRALCSVACKVMNNAPLNAVASLSCKSDFDTACQAEGVEVTNSCICSLSGSVVSGSVVDVVVISMLLCCRHS